MGLFVWYFERSRAQNIVRSHFHFDLEAAKDME